MWILPTAGLFLLIFVIIVLRALLIRPDKQVYKEAQVETPDMDRVTAHLSEAVKFPTISRSKMDETDWKAFRSFQQWIFKTYPLIAEQLERNIIHEYTIILKWEGTDRSLKPALFTAHQDVVPPGDESSWHFPPFSGTVKEGYLWGRGSLDIKVQLIQILESVEHLLSKKYKPRRTIYLAFGHDEEVNGNRGAAAAAAYFKSQGIRFSFLIDEGGCVTEGMLEGMHTPAATVGVVEKGYLDIEMTAQRSGGHSSMPPKHTSIGTLSQAIMRLEQKQMPLRMTPSMYHMLKSVSPYMSFRYRLITANLWLFRSLLMHMLAKSSTGNALLRSTITPTMAKGSSAPNVLSQKASTIINCRILPGDTTDMILKFIKKRTKSKYIHLDVIGGENPSKLSNISSREFAMLQETIRQIFPKAVTAPFIMVGGTDARKYEEVCDKIFRFSPYCIDKNELSRMHAYNERISLKNIEKGTQFFNQLIKNLQEDFLLL
ncbi:MAG: M20/M25/M40 family metallo-hydrolase [Spirochaetia bacterium]|nr:M20/M25/M40 family metallo-hydrolase [Spirochaetia bacterium]